MGANQCIKRFIIHGKLPLKYIFIVLHLTSKKHHHFWKSVFAYSLRSTALTRALFANWARGHGPWALWAMQNQSSIAGVAMQYKSIFGFWTVGDLHCEATILMMSVPQEQQCWCWGRRRPAKQKIPNHSPQSLTQACQRPTLCHLSRACPLSFPPPCKANPILLSAVVILIGAQYIYSIFQISTFS